MKLFGSSCLILCLVASFLPFCAVCMSRSDVPLESPFGERENIEFSSEEKTILSILGSLVGLSANDITSILSLFKLGLGVVDALESIFIKVFNGTSIDFRFETNPGADRQLLAMFEIVTLRLEQLQRGAEGTETSLRALVRGLPHMIRWEIALDTLEEYAKPINNLYHRFAYYQKHKLEVEDHTLVDFAESVVSHGTNSIQSLMANIHSMVSPSDPPVIRGTRVFAKDEYIVHNRVTSQLSSNLRRYISAHPDVKVTSKLMRSKMEELSLRPSVFVMLEDAIDNYEACNQKQSPQQLIFGLYTMIALTQARGYAMINFAYTLLRYHAEGNFTIERQLADELYIHYSKGLLRSGVQVLKRTANSFKRCDPKRHIENTTFVMVTELLQGYIENEVDLNKRGSCGNQCSYYQHAEVSGCYLPDKQYCGKHRRCKGKVHDCQYFDADAWVCLSSLPYRRYDWVRYENQKLLGNEGECSNLMKVDSWWRFFYHCSYCVCLCDDANSPTSDRFVSLLPVVSDIAAGRVVTGLRFTKKNRVIQLQVQEGKAMGQGQVDPDTIQWVDVNPLSVGTSKFDEGVDYVTLKYELRNFDLDHLKAPKDHVITGVKFRLLGSHVNLEVWVTPVNFTTGELKPKLSFWISNDNTPVMAQNPRKEVRLIDPDDPRRNNLESNLHSHSDMFVSLQETSMGTDISQLTVPFFDAQPVAPTPSTWLEGIQLYHRGRNGYGGFIGIKVFNFNLTRHFEEEEEDLNEIFL